jgi:chemotaxis protein MotA
MIDDQEIYRTVLAELPVEAVLIANPLYILKAIAGGIGGAFGGTKFSRDKYLETLKMMFEFFSRTRKEGLMALETDGDAPDKSPVFSKYPKFLKDHHALDFVCETIRMAASGGVEPFDVDQMMELDMDVHHAGALLPTAALSTMADSLPGLGIVAAVLGVVITMGALGGPPEKIGHKVAAALVGTFLGIPLCCGLIGPIASTMIKAVDEEHSYYHVMRVVIVSFMKGAPPSIAVEYGRRAIPGHVRPSFQDTGKTIKNRTRGACGVTREQNGGTSNHHQEEERTRRPSRRRVESCIGGLCHCDDGAFHRVVAHEFQQTDSGSCGRLLQGPHRNRQTSGQRYGWFRGEFYRRQRQHAGVERATAARDQESPELRQDEKSH